MIVYADSSALLKRVIIETESAAARDALARHVTAGDLVTASSLAWLEVWRSLRRAGARGVEDLASLAMSGVAEHELSADVLARARRVGTDALRTLDAVHLASALAVGADVLLTYDGRLADTARTVGVEVTSPT